ncbi:hypothetical protein AKO1_000537 [Acrasis kona]|uniref:Uncharacterized protein n=1 Tax=Acrasis kona TaxID=1008807 RepID=A0AAW2ZT18_9EUKA
MNAYVKTEMRLVFSDGETPKEATNLGVFCNGKINRLFGYVPDFGKEEKILVVSLKRGNQTQKIYNGVLYKGDDGGKPIEPEEPHTDHDNGSGDKSPDDPSSQDGDNSPENDQTNPSKKRKLDNGSGSSDVGHSVPLFNMSNFLISSFCRSFADESGGLTDENRIIQTASEWIDKRDMYGRPITFYLVSEPDAPISLIDSLFNECGYDVDEQDVFGGTCAHWAKHDGAIKQYERMVEHHDANVEIKNWDDVTASELEFDEQENSRHEKDELVLGEQDVIQHSVDDKKETIMHQLGQLQTDYSITKTDQGETQPLDHHLRSNQFFDEEEGVCAEFITDFEFNKETKEVEPFEIKAKVHKGTGEGKENRYYVSGDGEQVEYNNQMRNYFSLTLNHREEFYRDLFECKVSDDEQFISAKANVDMNKLRDAFKLKNLQSSHKRIELNLQLSYEWIEQNVQTGLYTRKMIYDSDDFVLLSWDDQSNTRVAETQKSGGV